MGRKKKLFGNEHTVLLILFFDEYETNNPLGSHWGIQKCGAPYLKIPTLPPNFQSKVQNVFLFGLLNTHIRNDPNIFEPAIDQLNRLETHGINIHINGKLKTIYFKLISIV